jgi:N-dimethylarginine dimethylaminohydrolase
MLRVCIKPTTFTILPIQDKQNPYIDIKHRVDRKKAAKQHDALVKSFANVSSYTIEDAADPIPDIVFVANGGLCLPRLGRPVILLPNMKYKQRKDEYEYLEGIYGDMGLETMPFPGNEPFEGQAELKWFDGGKKAICGYGHRSTKKTFTILEKLFKKLYGRRKPELLVIPLQSADYYHLDVAMLEFDDAKCIIHERAFSEASIKKIQNFLGPENVFVIDTPDSFCLNAVVDGPNLITHTLAQPLKTYIEKITDKKIIMVDTSEFEKSGGSVRCMTLDIFI